MQKVSKAYKESMKSSLRERAYIMISFGLVNQEAQAKATVDNGSYAYYSNKDNIFGEHIDDTVYATLEEEFTKVDGSMFFLPRATEGGRYYDTGIVSDKLVSEARCEVVISLNTIATDFKGLTINFGENYPVDFDIVGSTGQTIEFRGNAKSKWSTEEVLENTTYIKLVFYKMKNPQSRLRIYSIMFGYGLVYYNDSVMSSSLDSYVSPIGADVPQFDFSVTLKNYDHYFNVDNPNSAINYLETGQEMDIMYGYQTPGSDTIEWIQGNHLWCSEWESDDNTATIRCQDIFRNMDGEYVKGLYSAAGKSYYALAEEILKDAGISEYYIDPRLKKLYSNNPIPRWYEGKYLPSHHQFQASIFGSSNRPKDWRLKCRGLHRKPIGTVRLSMVFTPGTDSMPWTSIELRTTSNTSVSWLSRCMTSSLFSLSEAIRP